MLNLGWGELVVVAVVALIVFGPNRLPEIARSMGKFIRNFQHETSRALNDLKEGLEPPIEAGVIDRPDPGSAAEPDVAAIVDPDSGVLGEEAPAPAVAAARPAVRKASVRKAPVRKASVRKPAARKASVRKAPIRKTRAAGAKKTAGRARPAKGTRRP